MCLTCLCVSESLLEDKQDLGLGVFDESKIVAIYLVLLDHILGVFK